MPLIASSFMCNLGIILMGLLNSMLLSRWLLPSGRGELAAAMLWPTLLTYLGSLGLIDATTYFTATRHGESGTILSNSMAFAWAQSAVVIPIGYFALPYLLAGQEQMVVDSSRVFLLVIPLSLMTQYALSSLQGNMLISLVNALRAIIPTGYLGATLLFQTLGVLSPRSLVIAMLILNGVTLLISLLILRRARIPLGTSFEPGLCREMIKYGLKVQSGTFAQVTNLRLDQVVMVSYLSPRELGLYVTAANAAGVSQCLSQAIRTVAVPRIAGNDDPMSRLAELSKSIRLLAALGAIAFPALALLLYFGIPHLLGVEYQGAVWVAEVLLVSNIILGFKDVLMGGAQALGHPWLGSSIELLSLVVTIPLLWAFLPRFGMMGAAAASVASCGLSLIVLIIVIMNLMRMYTRGITAAHGIVGGLLPIEDRS